MPNSPAVTEDSFAFEPHSGSVRTLVQHMRGAVMALDVESGGRAMALACELAAAAVTARTRFEVTVRVDRDVLRLELETSEPIDLDLLEALARDADRGGVADDGRPRALIELDVRSGASLDDACVWLVGAEGPHPA